MAKAINMSKTIKKRAKKNSLNQWLYKAKKFALVILLFALATTVVGSTFYFDQKKAPEQALAQSAVRPSSSGLNFSDTGSSSSNNTSTSNTTSSNNNQPANPSVNNTNTNTQSTPPSQTTTPQATQSSTGSGGLSGCGEMEEGEGITCFALNGNPVTASTQCPSGYSLKDIGIAGASSYGCRAGADVSSTPVNNSQTTQNNSTQTQPASSAGSNEIHYTADTAEYNSSSKSWDSVEKLDRPIYRSCGSNVAGILNRTCQKAFEKAKEANYKGPIKAHRSRIIIKTFGDTPPKDFISKYGITYAQNCDTVMFRMIFYKFGNETVWFYYTESGQVKGIDKPVVNNDFLGSCFKRSELEMPDYSKEKFVSGSQEETPSFARQELESIVSGNFVTAGKTPTESTGNNLTSSVDSKIANSFAKMSDCKANQDSNYWISCNKVDGNSISGNTSCPDGWTKLTVGNGDICAVSSQQNPSLTADSIKIEQGKIVANTGGTTTNNNNQNNNSSENNTQNNNQSVPTQSTFLKNSSSLGDCKTGTGSDGYFVTCARINGNNLWQTNNAKCPDGWTLLGRSQEMVCAVNSKQNSQVNLQNLSTDGNGNLIDPKYIKDMETAPKSEIQKTFPQVSNCWPVDDEFKQVICMNVKDNNGQNVQVDGSNCPVGWEFFQTKAIDPVNGRVNDKSGDWQGIGGNLGTPAIKACKLDTKKYPEVNKYTFVGTKQGLKSVKEMEQQIIKSSDNGKVCVRESVFVRNKQSGEYRGFHILDANEQQDGCVPDGWEIINPVMCPMDTVYYRTDFVAGGSTENTTTSCGIDINPHNKKYQTQTILTPAAFESAKNSYSVKQICGPTVVQRISTGKLEQLAGPNNCWPENLPDYTFQIDWSKVPRSFNGVDNQNLTPINSPTSFQKYDDRFGSSEMTDLTDCKKITFNNNGMSYPAITCKIRGKLITNVGECPIGNWTLENYSGQPTQCMRLESPGETYSKTGPTVSSDGKFIPSDKSITLADIDKTSNYEKKYDLYKQLNNCRNGTYDIQGTQAPAILCKLNNQAVTDEKQCPMSWAINKTTGECYIEKNSSFSINPDGTLTQKNY